MRVKICGITRPEDARAALSAGAHALGLNFYPQSPRAISIEQARAIAAAAGPLVTLVGLFVDAGPEQIESVLEKVPLQLLQFHGQETAGECERYGRPYIKALRMHSDMNPLAAMDDYPGASGFLLDAYRKGTPGGTGETFDWARVPHGVDRPIILAGGLTPDNVDRAIAATAPYGVDVSGGVEAAPGRKDAERMRQFVSHALNGDSR